MKANRISIVLFLASILTSCANDSQRRIEDLEQKVAYYESELSKNNEMSAKYGNQLKAFPNIQDSLLYYKRVVDSMRSLTKTTNTNSVCIFPTKMNVFYVGVDNPIEISASGIPADKIVASISGGGSIRRTNGSNYIVNVKNSGSDVTINCSANIDGSTKTLGTRKFRVKRIPDPKPMVGNISSGTIAKNELVSKTVVAKMENFDFDVKFTIVSFSVSATVRGFYQSEKGTTATFNDKQKQLVSSLPFYTKVFIEDIIARGPDGSTRNLGAMSFTVK